MRNAVIPVNRDDPPYQPQPSTRTSSEEEEEDDDREAANAAGNSQPPDGQAAGGLSPGILTSGQADEFEPIPRARKRKPS